MGQKENEREEGGIDRSVAHTRWKKTNSIIEFEKRNTMSFFPILPSVTFFCLLSDGNQRENRITTISITNKKRRIIMYENERKLVGKTKGFKKDMKQRRVGREETRPWFLF